MFWKNLRIIYLMVILSMIQIFGDLDPSNIMTITRQTFIKKVNILMKKHIVNCGMIITNTVINMKCKTPKLIYVSDYKTFIKVPCGTCYACQCNSRAEWVLRVRTEFDKFRKIGGTSYFCTFTYNDDNLYAPHLPLQTRRLMLDNARLIVGKYKDVDFGYYDEYAYLDTFPDLPFPDYGDFLLNPDHASQLIKDLQFNYRMIYYEEQYKNYLKFSRLACKYYRLCDFENACYYKQLAVDNRPPLVRMYLVGEYGDLTYRPHLHSLFFFPNEVTVDDLTNILFKVWQYGNIDVGYSVEVAAINYVAKHQVKDCCGNEFQQKVSPQFARSSRYDGGIGYSLRDDPLIQFKYDNRETEDQCIKIEDGSKEYYFAFPRYVKKFLHPEKFTYDEIQDVVNITNQSYYDMVTETAITNNFNFKNLRLEDQVFLFNKEQDEKQRFNYKENKLLTKKLHYHGQEIS